MKVERDFLGQSVKRLSEHYNLDDIRYNFIVHEMSLDLNSLIDDENPVDINSNKNKIEKYRLEILIRNRDWEEAGEKLCETENLLDFYRVGGGSKYRRSSWDK